MESSRANFTQVHNSAIDIFFVVWKTVLKCQRVSKYFVHCDPIATSGYKIYSSLSPRAPDSGRIHDIFENLEHVARFTFSLLLWMQLLWLSSNVKKFNSVSPMLSNFLTFSYTKEELLKLVSAIFYQIFVFSSNDRPSTTIKNVFCFI